MRSLSFRFALSAAAAAMVSMVPLGTPLAAQSADAAPVLARFRTAVGAGNLSAIKTMRWTGAMEIAAAGVSMAVTVEQASPNRMIMTAEIPGMGSMRQGFDGKTGWSVDPMQGPRVVSGKELQDLEVQADLRALVRDAALITNAKRGADTTVAGEACTLVSYQWTSGREGRDCYATGSGLLIASMGKQATPGGEVDVVTLYSDYKPVAGVQIPHTTRVSLMGQEQTIRITKIEANVPTGDLQALPAEIVPLVKK